MLPISWNVSASSMRSMRSRTVSRPPACWRATRSAPPISRASAWRWRSSASSGSQLSVDDCAAVAGCEDVTLSSAIRFRSMRYSGWSLRVWAIRAAAQQSHAPLSIWARTRGVCVGRAGARCAAASAGPRDRTRGRAAAARFHLPAGPGAGRAGHSPCIRYSRLLSSADAMRDRLPSAGRSVPFPTARRRCGRRPTRWAS